jgi:hypothetical protein
VNAAPLDLEARARWHLEIGYPEVAIVVPLQYDDEGEGEYLGEHVTCWKCGGEGFELVCIDDICHGLGYCIHGDGQIMCRLCNGEGLL